MQAGHYSQNYRPGQQIQKRLDRLLNHPVDRSAKEIITFKKRMVKYKDYILTCLNHPDVPPDNNASERAIRNIKVKQKISGQFKAQAAAEKFAILRSIIDTTIKNRNNVVDVLTMTAHSVRAD